MSEKKLNKKKPIYKRFWFWALVVFVVIVAANAGGGSDSSNNTGTNNDKTAQSTKQSKESTSTSDTTDAQKDDATTSVDAQNDDKITLEKYNSIKVGDSLTGEGGMTIDQVVSILGEPTDKSESSSGNVKMEIYSWSENVAGDLGANMSVDFINGKASGKSQFGMK